MRTFIIIASLKSVANCCLPTPDMDLPPVSSTTGRYQFKNLSILTLISSMIVYFFFIFWNLLNYRILEMRSSSTLCNPGEYCFKILYF